MRVRRLIACLIPALAILLAACGGSGGVGSEGGHTSEPTSEAPKVFRVAYTFEPGSLDPALATDNAAGTVLYHLSEGLVRYAGGKVVPGIAETWDVSPDGLTYTFHLRDASWQDGKPVTADDFAYSFLRLVSPDTASPVADVAFDIANAQAYHDGQVTDASQVGVKALDPKTLEIRLDHPVPYFVSLLASQSAFYPVRQDVVEAARKDYGTDAQHFIGDGPFRLESWQHQASLRLVKNPDYWDAKSVKLDAIEVSVVPDSNTILNMYDNGDIDAVLNIPAGQEVRYPDHGARWGGSIAFLEFNLKGKNAAAGKLVGNLHFREALSAAIDRTTFVHTAVSALAIPTNRFAHPSWPGTQGAYASEFAVPDGLPLSGDPAQAKALLQQALQETGLSADRLPTLTFVIFDNLPRRTIAEALVETWRQVLGLQNIEIQTLPIPQAIQAGFQGQFDIYYQTMSAQVDPYLFLRYWTSTNGLNWTHWQDAAYDRMLDEANRQLDPAARLAALRDAEAYLIENGPLAPLAYDRTTYVVRPGVTGLDLATPGPDFDAISADVGR